MNIDELLKTNANLEDYVNEYYENPKFMLDYYLQDINRITKNFYLYSAFLFADDKLQLFKIAIDNKNYEVANVLLIDIDNIYLSSHAYKETIDKVFSELIELDKDGKIDINRLNKSVFLYRSNPLYFIKKDTSNIKHYYYDLDINTINEILNYLFSINYKFMKDDEPFITKCVIKKQSCLISFLQKAEYEPDIDNLISDEFNKLSCEELYELYNNVKNSNKENILYRMLSKLNYNNYDYNTIVKDKDLCLNCDNKDKLISLLKEIGNNYPANIILVMNRVNMDIVNEAYSLVGDSLRILPLANQTSDRFNSYRNLKDHPYYDYNYIKQSEDKLDLYASMVSDTKDKDGDIKSLSPLEKFIAAYILASKFAPYKEGSNNGYDSRSVYEFINSVTGTKIVCTGFAHLLKEILYRMGITDTIDWSVKVNDSSFADSGHHMRMMIHLVDPKYGIDGIYMSDPTFDNRKDTELNFKHMLMSHDELSKVDRDIDLNDLKANEINLMEDELHVKDAYKMFRKPIPKEALVKAHLALEHFLDKNMKMVNDGNYDLLEYTEMADKLQFYDISEANNEKVFNKLENMSINEINNNYPGLLDNFLYNLSTVINNKLQENGVINSLMIKYNHDEEKTMLGYKFRYQSEEFPEYDLTQEDIDELKELIPLNNVNKRTSEIMFYVEINKDKKVSEQLNELINKLIEMDSICQNITSKNKENEVK